MNVVVRVLTYQPPTAVQYSRSQLLDSIRFMLTKILLIPGVSFRGKYNRIPYLGFEDRRLG